MAQSRAKQFSVMSNESAPDEMAQYLVKLYSVISNSTALREILSWAYIQTVQPKTTYTARREVVQRNIKWHSVA